MPRRRGDWVDARADLPVLIVDDNSDTRMALSAVLGIRGYRTVEVNDGAQALDYLRSAEQGAALVLLDLHMPRLDGHSFLAHKVADPRLRDIPVLVYSAVDGHGLPPDVPYLRKGSSTADQLLDMIERTIR
jgi:CheY-like chemotaxis protein